MNASSEDRFNQYTKDLLMSGQGKPSLIQIVNDMIKTKESYVKYVIDHTPDLCVKVDQLVLNKITQVLSIY